MHNQFWFSLFRNRAGLHPAFFRCSSEASGGRGGVCSACCIVNALSYSLIDLVTDSPPTQDTELIIELALTLTSCPEEEKASIIRIFREMLRMIRLIRTGNQNSE